MGPGSPNGGDWVSFHRNFGDDREENGVTYSNHGTSEAVMRNQFKAWADYMQALTERRWRTRRQRQPRDPERRRPTSSTCSRRTS